MARTRIISQQIVRQPRSIKEAPNTIAERKTDEIVFGMVGPIASGVTFTSNALSQLLMDEYGYTGEILKVSTLINLSANKVELPLTPPDAIDRITLLQNTGNALRSKYGNRYLAEACVREINMKRGNPEHLATPRRHFTIIDSLKTPDEIAVLREVYEDAFCLIGVFAPETVRIKRLKGNGLSDSQIHTILERDQSEGLEHGQNVRETMEFADFYIRNDGDNDAKIKTALNRFVEVLFGIGVQTPTRDELAMQAATSMSTASACLSRQVGAVIANSSGEIIGQGMNDVPKYGGGLYNSQDGDHDNRCWKWKSKICHNDAHKNRIMSKVEINLAEAQILKRESGSGIRAAISKAGIKDLIEFSRSVHAEMEAIVSIARTGKPGLVGSTLYTKTFPCHNCARHIVASGVQRVIYIEPYAKSLALDLHDDAISTNDADDGRKVLFLQFEGIAPRNIIKLFTKVGERKEDGRLRTKARNKASPASHEPLDGFTTREQFVVVDLSKRENASTDEASSD